MGVNQNARQTKVRRLEHSKIFIYNTSHPAGGNSHESCCCFKAKKRRKVVVRFCKKTKEAEPQEGDEKVRPTLAGSAEEALNHVLYFLKNRLGSEKAKEIIGRCYAEPWEKPAPASPKPYKRKDPRQAKMFKM